VRFREPKGCMSVYITLSDLMTLLNEGYGKYIVTWRYGRFPLGWHYDSPFGDFEIFIKPEDFPTVFLRLKELKRR